MAWVDVCVTLVRYGATLASLGKSKTAVLFGAPWDDASAQLKELNESSILHSLRMRFGADCIYTCVSSILISVNPFKRIDRLYESDLIDQYEAEQELLPPHIFTGQASCGFPKRFPQGSRSGGWCHFSGPHAWGGSPQQNCIANAC